MSETFPEFVAKWDLQKCSEFFGVLAGSFQEDQDRLDLRFGGKRLVKVKQVLHFVGGAHGHRFDLTSPYPGMDTPFSFRLQVEGGEDPEVLILVQPLDQLAHERFESVGRHVS